MEAVFKCLILSLDILIKFHLTIKNLQQKAQRQQFLSQFQCWWGIFLIFFQNSNMEPPQGRQIRIQLWKEPVSQEMYHKSQQLKFT